jgi:hypothetical protein
MNYNNYSGRKEVAYEDMMTQEELERRVKSMSDEEQAHFKLLIHKLVMCYGEGKAQGVVIIGRAEDQMAGVVTLNCDEMEASQLMLAANDFFGFLNILDAPPKENFN